MAVVCVHSDVVTYTAPLCRKQHRHNSMDVFGVLADCLLSVGVVGRFEDAEIYDQGRPAA